MGLDPRALPQKFIRRMERADRKSLGKAGVTTEEAAARQQRTAERALHAQIEAILNQRGLYFVHSRMDRPTTTRKGVPDFIIVLPDERAWLVEVKVPGGRVTEDQQAEQVRFYKATEGVITYVYSLADFINRLRDKLPEL